MSRDEPRNPLFCAIDTADKGRAMALVGAVAGAAGGLKVGLEYFGAHGPQGTSELAAAAGLPLFLDLKFHDIPNTVAGAVRSACAVKPFIINVHATGGPAMMRAALDAATAAGGASRPLVLAVTVLTSLDDTDLDAVGLAGPASDGAIRLAQLAQSCGLDGVVCSARELVQMRSACGPDFKLLVPGIRPAGAATDDQKRTLTPAEAMARGADYLVVGRPITAADDPAAAARRIGAELAA